MTTPTGSGSTANNGSHDAGTGGFSLPALDLPTLDVQVAPGLPPADGVEPRTTAPDDQPPGPGTIELDGPSGSFS
jgi:hypothetical protein